MKLHYAPQSPFARKARAAAIELGLSGSIDLEYTEVVPGHPNKAFGQSHNPLRKIPALVLDDGTTIYDSTVICEYLDDLAGGGIIIPQDTSRRWRVLTSHALAQGLCASQSSLSVTKPGFGRKHCDGQAGRMSTGTRSTRAWHGLIKITPSWTGQLMSPTSHWEACLDISTSVGRRMAGGVAFHL